MSLRKKFKAFIRCLIPLWIIFHSLSLIILGIMSNGKIVHSGDAKTILDDPEIGEYFLGSTGH